MKYVIPLLWLASGCVQDQESMPITHFVILDQTTNQCVAMPAGPTFRSRGLLDVGVTQAQGNPRGYILAPVMHNGTVSTSSNVNAEMDNIFVNGFDVELHPDPNDSLLTNAIASTPNAGKFHLESAAGVVAPGGDIATQFEAVPYTLALSLFPLMMDQQKDFYPLTVHVRATGDKGGIAVHSGFVDFPVYICRYCLTPAIMPCPSTGFAMANVVLGNGCQAQQDSNVTCCSTSDHFVRCGSEVPTHM